MDNPLKYSDLLQPDNSITDAISQLKELNQTYAATLKTVKDEAIKLQTSIEGASGATEQQRTKIREAAAQVDRLTKSQKDLEFAMSDTAKEIAALNLQKQEAQQIAKLTAKLNSSEAGSYNALSAQYSLNKIQLNKLSQEYRENTAAGKQLVKETEEIYAKMKVLQESTGKYTLNVGNYASAWNGLGVSAQQLVRELPSLAVSANTFFLAISNNIPMLVDEINKLKLANAAAAAAGNATVPVWKSVAKAFLSWNTAISLGITLITVYGGDLVKWVGNLFKAEKQVDALAEAQKAVNEAQQAGKADAQQSIVRLRLLYDATQDVTRSTEERKKAADALKAQYPAYFQNLTDEAILAGKAAGKYNELSQAIIKTAMARDAEDKLVENSKKILELDEQKAEATKTLNDAQERLRKTEKAYQKARSGSAAKDVLSQDVQFYSQQAAVAKTAYANAQKAVDTIDDQITALQEANKKLADTINISDLTADPTGKGTGTTGTSGDRTQQIEKKNLEIAKQLYESRTALIQDEAEKERQALLDAYNAEVADLRNKLQNDKDLTEESRQSINEIILNKQEKLSQDLARIDEELRQKSLEAEQQLQQQKLDTEKQSIQVRLAVVQRGSDEENALRIQLLENARKQELLKNSQLAEDMKQDEAAINAKYDRQILEQDSNFYQQKEMLMFDQQQALDQSEFDLLETTEKQKTIYKLNAEKQRLLKILQLNEQYGNKLSDQEVQTIRNTIAKINDEIEEASRSTEQRDIYDLLGIKLDSSAKQAIQDAVSFTIQQLQSILDAQVQIKDQILQNAKEETQAAQDRLNQEIEARNNGYANDVQTAQRELQLAKDKEAKALAEKQKAQKQQQALDTLTQTSSLITASANIWSSLSGIPIVGYALAAAALALMWSSFIGAKIKAREVTQTQYGEGGFEYLDGGSHQSGKDIDLGMTADGKNRRAEGGEGLAIINKTSTRKYRKVLPKIIKSINNGTFEAKYLDAFSDAGGLSINVQAGEKNMNEIKGYVKKITEQNDERIYIDRRGNMIIKHKNLTRRIRS